MRLATGIPANHHNRMSSTGAVESDLNLENRPLGSFELTIRTKAPSWLAIKMRPRKPLSSTKRWKPWGRLKMVFSASPRPREPRLGGTQEFNHGMILGKFRGGLLGRPVYHQKLSHLSFWA